MTEQQYFDRIHAIRRHISGGNLELAERLLEQMYSYKPTRLLWFVAKAELVLKKEQNPEAALRVLDGKYLLGEDYPGLKECMKFRSKTYRQWGRPDDAAREDYLYQKACGRSCARPEGEVIEALEAVAEDTENGECLQALAGALYRTSDMAAYFIVYMELVRRGLARREEHWVHKIANYGYLEEKLTAQEPGTFILVMDDYLDRPLEILGHLLHCFGHQVFLLSPPLAFETEGQVDLKETVPISMEQMERYPDMCVVPPVVLTEEGKPYGDNRDYIIDQICREESARDHAVILCSGYLLEDLYTREGLRGRMGRLSPYEADFTEEKVQFAWAGSYLSYISDIYGYDVRTDIDREPEVEFSIVIPARNSAATLRYTLQTCLNQRYQGSYEIVISDNSVDESHEVYDLCQELNDPRIRYIKTPRSLQLTKSFEFAYLQTRGKFVFSLGSDDGLLPWALEAVKITLDHCPEEELLLWDRGFYAWPGFNGGQQNMFAIPRAYKRGQLNARLVETKELLSRVAQNQSNIYLLPLLYINSGFRRSYLNTLLRKTGKLLDGACQDIAVGIINCSINEHILCIAYPITIAGMSNSSIGYLNSSPDKNCEDEKQRQIIKTRIFHQDNVGIYTPAYKERLVFPVSGDACGIYMVLSRAVEEGVLSEDICNHISDWEATVERVVETFSLQYDVYDLMVHMNSFMARKLPMDHYEWFEAHRSHILSPKYVDAAEVAREHAKKCYQEGRSISGGEILDASKYGIENIAQAVGLFSDRTGL